MITPHDDFPLHQTSKPIMTPSDGDANRYDRFFFNGYNSSGSLYFGVAMGLYPVRETIDASFSVILDGGEQVNVHASGRCPLNRTQTAVGPITVRIIEPMQVLQIVVDAPEHGLRADITFTASTQPVEELPFTLRNGARTVFDYTRLTQWGSWDGWVEVDGRRVNVSPDQIMGSRDRSWGVRPVGQQVPGPVSSHRQFYWLWAPTNFSELCTHFDVNEYADGSRWHESGFIVPKDGTEPHWAEPTYRIALAPGTRHAAMFAVDLQPRGGPLYTVELEPFLTFQMVGIGYGHPERTHGRWHSDLSVVGDRWPLPVADPLLPTSIHIQALSRATLKVDGVVTDRGTGILEQLIIGPHEPNGLTSVLDGAPA